MNRTVVAEKMRAVAALFCEIADELENGRLKRYPEGRSRNESVNGRRRWTDEDDQELVEIVKSYGIPVERMNISAIARDISAGMERTPMAVIARIRKLMEEGVMK